MIKKEDKRCFLYIIQNIFVFMEECFVREPACGDYYTLNPLYVRDLHACEELKMFIGRLYPEMKYVDFESIFDVDWEKVYLSSYFSDPSKLDGLSYNEMILVEDGLFDYIQEDVKAYEFYKGKVLYVFKPNLTGKFSKLAKEIREFEVLPAIKEKFMKLYEKELKTLRELDENISILFTAPLEEDFGADDQDLMNIIKHLEKKFEGQTILVKKHPRDHFEYNSKAIHFIECNQIIPGQIIDSMFKGDKIYLFPSSVSFMSGEDAKIVYLNTLPSNKNYCKSFNALSNLLASKNKNITISSL